MMKKHLLLLLILLSVGIIPAKKKTVIKMATLAPEGTDWYGLLADMGQQWKEATNGEIILRIYPSGIVGDERDMIRKMRIGQIHSAAITVEGLTELNQDVAAFYIPLLYQNYDDVDYIRSGISEEIEKGIAENGFKLLYWADVGFAYWFTTKPISSPEELKKLKIFTWAGDYKTSKLWKNGGYNSVSLASTDILTGLQTNLINAISTTPLFALSTQVFGISKYMLDMKWGMMTAAVVIDLRTWNKISIENRTIMMDIAKSIGNIHQDTNRHNGSAAIEAMKKHGLIVTPQTEEEFANWQKVITDWYPDIRGTLVPEGIFDRVIQLKAEKDSHP